MLVGCRGTFRSPSPCGAAEPDAAVLINLYPHLLADRPGEEVSPIGAEEIKRLNINFDLQLHNAFKATAAARGENMTDVLLKCIEDYVARYRYDMRPKKEKKERRQ